MKDIQIRKEAIKLLLFLDGEIIYIEKPKSYIKIKIYQ